MKNVIWLLVALTCAGSTSFAQNAHPKLVEGWHLLDKDQDSVYGISLQQAYQYLQGRKSKTTIVAIIDSGIDTLHEDLKDVLWVNTGEIAGNGKDDDNNGYVDDIHGWNFLGGKDGKNLNEDTYEFVRIYHRFEGKYAKADPMTIRPADKEQYAMWLKARSLYLLADSLDKAANGNKDRPDSQYRNYRGDVVKDNEEDIGDRFYGNNDVMGTFNFHCTHVAGIIGANRNNAKGIKGVADNVKIMALRAIPNGDEHDKDVALAIRYAVGNGARVINMSFYKGFSPDKEWVDDAVQYAASKGVLLIHAAGNDGEDIDVVDNFPSPVLKRSKSRANNWITVGATSDASRLSFSNYGKKGVDVFSPGAAIFSTLPGDKYGSLDGTSMAAPVVTGLAALIFSYFPYLTPQQVKAAIERSVVVPLTNAQQAGSETKTQLAKFSKYGGIINAFRAVKYAAAIKEARKSASYAHNGQ